MGKTLVALETTLCRKISWITSITHSRGFFFRINLDNHPNTYAKVRQKWASANNSISLRFYFLTNYYRDIFCLINIVEWYIVFKCRVEIILFLREGSWEDGLPKLPYFKRYFIGYDLKIMSRLLWSIVTLLGLYWSTLSTNNTCDLSLRPLWLCP